jgi:hypothetical protein
MCQPPYLLCSPHHLRCLAGSLEGRLARQADVRGDAGWRVGCGSWRALRLYNTPRQTSGAVCVAPCLLFARMTAARMAGALPPTASAGRDASLRLLWRGRTSRRPLPRGHARHATLRTPAVGSWQAAASCSVGRDLTLTRLTCGAAAAAARVVELGCGAWVAHRALANNVWGVAAARRLSPPAAGTLRRRHWCQLAVRDGVPATPQPSMASALGGAARRRACCRAVGVP